MFSSSLGWRDHKAEPRADKTGIVRAALPEGCAMLSLSSWPGLSRPSTTFSFGREHVDARDKPGHDVREEAIAVHEPDSERRRDYVHLISSTTEEDYELSYPRPACRE